MPHLLSSTVVPSSKISVVHIHHGVHQRVSQESRKVQKTKTNQVVHCVCAQETGRYTWHELGGGVMGRRVYLGRGREVNTNRKNKRQYHSCLTKPQRVIFLYIYLKSWIIHTPSSQGSEANWQCCPTRATKLQTNKTQCQEESTLLSNGWPEKSKLLPKQHSL